MLWRKIDFGEYGPSHGLIVVDMQLSFLQNPHHSNKDNIRILIRKIESNIERCIGQWWEVILIEFDGVGGNTLPHLKNAVLRWKQKSWNNTWLSHKITKGSNGVLSNLPNNSKYLNENKEFFLRRIEKLYTIGGVNAYFCVSECASQLDKIGCKVRIDVWLTMNASRSIHNQKISRLVAPSRIIHAPAISPQFYPIFRWKSFLEYL